MTMTADTPSSLPASSPWLRVGLVVLSGVILLDAVPSFPSAFSDHGYTDRLLVFAQRVMNVKLALAPFIAGAALLFTIRNKITHAIVALATLMLLGWLTDLPDFAIDGMKLGGGSYALVVAAQRFLYPLLAVSAMALALRNERLVTAAVLTAIPTIVNWLGVLIFTISVIRYGF